MLTTHAVMWAWPLVPHSALYTEWVMTGSGLQEKSVTARGAPAHLLLIYSSAAHGREDAAGAVLPSPHMYY